MMKVILTLGAISLLSITFVACGGESAKTSSAGAATDTGGAASASTTPAADAGDVKEYTFHGTIKKIDTERAMITIDHEQIGDYMDAMTMPFKVADPALLDQVKVGQQSHFTLRVSGDQALLTKVQDDHEPGADH